MTSARHVEVLSISLFLCMIGCSSEAPGGAEEVVTVPPDSVHVVGTTESLASVIDLQPTADGTIWVINSVAPFFIAIRPDGSIARSWGTRGKGPRELQTPNTLVAGASANDVWAYERTRHGFVRVTVPDGEWQELLLSRDSLSRVLTFDEAGHGDTRRWIRWRDDQFVLAHARESVEDGLRLWNADIVALNPVDGSFRTLFVIADLLGDPTERYPRATTFLPYPLWALCPDRTLVLYDPLQNTLRRFAQSASETSPLTLPPERKREVTMDRVFRMVFIQMREEAPPNQRPDSAELYAELQEEWKQLQNEVSSVFPEYSNLHCAEDNVVWLQHFDIESGRFGTGPNWLRIMADGTTRKVLLPDRFTPFRFEGGRIWGVLYDDLDVASVAWIKTP